jgi:hypothetical protein
MFAGFVQALIVSGISVATVVLVGVDQYAQSEREGTTGAVAIGASTFLAWSDILVAVCVSMVRTRFVDTTALRFRDGFRRVSPRDPDLAASSLLVQLSLAAMGFALLAMKPPPAYVLSIGTNLGSAGYGTILWPATTSTFIAVFGASAHAALIAKRLNSG